MIHRIHGHGAIGIKPAELNQLSFLFLARHGIELLQIRRDAGRKILFAQAHGIGCAFRFHLRKVLEDEQRSKVLWLKVADDGGGIPHGDLDMGFQFQARAFKDRLAFLEHAPDGAELAVQRGFNDG